MMKDKTKCTNEFGRCRKYEDEVGKVINTCCIKYCANGSYVWKLKQDLKSVVMNIECLHLLNDTITNNLTVVNSIEIATRTKRFNITLDESTWELDTGSQAASISTVYVKMIRDNPIRDVCPIGTTIINQMVNGIKFTRAAFTAMVRVQDEIQVSMVAAVNRKASIHHSFKLIYGTTLSPAALVEVSYPTIGLITEGTVHPDGGVQVGTGKKTSMSTDAPDITFSIFPTSSLSKSTDIISSGGDSNLLSSSSNKITPSAASEGIDTTIAPSNNEITDSTKSVSSASRKTTTSISSISGSTPHPYPKAGTSLIKSC